MSLQEYSDNRRNLYENLLGDGYFRGEDGEINFSFEEFSEGLDNRDNATVFYENLLGDGYFRNEDGSVQLSLSDFLEMIGCARPEREFYPITENQRGVYIDWDMNRDTTQYNIVDVTPIHGHCAREVKEAVIQVINAHPYIKTRLVLKDGDVMQQRRDSDSPEVSVESLDFEPDTAFFQKRVRPFDLLNDRLYRIEIYQTPSSVYLFTDFHHIAFDGGSSLVFAGNLEAALNGEAVEPERFSSFDVALNEAELISSDEFAEAERHFDGMLSGFDTTVFPHSQNPDGKAVGNVNFWVHSTAVQSYCRRNAVTEGNFFLTMMLIALHRLTREEQVVATAINNGRNSLDMMNIFGMFVKTLPVSLSVDENGGTVKVSDFVKALNGQFNETVRHSIYPFTLMTERYGLRPEIMFAYQPAGKYSWEESAAAAESLTLDTVKTPIAIDVLAYDGGHYRIALEYDGMLYSKDDMSALSRVMGNITSYSLAHDCTLGELPLIDDNEKKRVVELSRGEKMEVDFSRTFVSLFTEQAGKSPQATALVGEDGTYTYAELDRRTNAFARYLRGKGVQDGEFVCVELVASSNFIIAAIGIQKAGAAYVPVDPSYPEERRQYISEDSESRLTVTEATFAEVDWSDDAAIDRAKPESAAYMIYTSGSTGKPKGVMVPHRGLVNLILFTVKEWKLTSDCRMSVHDSVSFDASIEDLFPPFVVGGTLYPIPQDVRKDLSMVRDFIVENGINSGNYTTQFGLLLAQAYPDLPLDYMNVGGEKMTTNPRCSYRMINTYGPTEVTVNSTYFFLEPGREYRNIPIGRPLHNLSCYVLDNYGHLLPRGMAGELVISGPQVALGYWKREELTAEKFVDCPYDEGKMYHTGDLVRYNDDGEIEYLGRIDNQVKLRGFRIELGEIESLLAGYEGIGMCSVQVKEVGGVQHLCAYYSADSEIDKEVLKEYLSTQLTEYMVPTSYMQLDTMPLTPNGKINTKALPQPEVKVEQTVAPETETEKKLFDIAVELLKHDQFGVTSNLIGMGLTSLGAMRLGIMIKQAFDKAVPTRDIMQNPTLRLLADIIDGRTSIGATQIAKVHEIQQYYPLTENQRGVYIDWEMNREALQYNIADVFVFRNQNPEELCAALKKTVDAHPILKARVAHTEGDVSLVRRDDAEPVVSIFEGVPDKYSFQARVRPFDLFNDDLYRLEIYCPKENPEKTYLFADFHHIVFDGGSSLVFLDDLQRILRGETIDAETYTAFDRALDEQEMRQSEIYANAEKYFSGLLSEYEVANYPRSAVPASVEPGLAHETATVSGKDVSALCKEQSLTENSFFMTVVSQALHRILREDSLLFTSITNGRTTPEMERICGMFVQTLPVVSGFSKESVLDAVKAMQGQFIETQYNSICPYTKLVETYGIRAEIMYVYQGTFGNDSQTEQETSESGYISLDLDTAKLPILISVYPQGEDFVVDLEYDTSLYSGKDMGIFSEAIKTLAEAAACHPDEKMSALSLVTPEQKEKLLALGTTPELEFDKRLTLVDLLRRQATASPDEVAVVFRDRQLTYSELDTLTDALAVHLHNSGVEPETAVGVMIERSELMAVYPIAIMKAGAAYMPLDSHFPEDRLTFMCEDAGIKLILSDPGLVGKAMPSFYGRVFESTELESLAQVSGNEVASLPKVSPENMFVILYTSGSTGKPKGCMLEHHNIVNFCHWYVDEFDVTAADRAVAYANFGFDAHMMDLYPALSVGARVYVIPEEMRMDMVALNDYMEANGLTIAFLTTQIGYMFATAFENKSLRLLSVGGEKLQPIRKPSYRFYNGYGPTECTLYSTSYNIEKDYDSSLIGRPLAGYQLRIVDKCLQMVPQGVAGELVVIGAGVGRGYLNRPDINADKFITLEGKRAYRTGDLVRWSPDGNIEYLGRIDNQVKMRGLRIELGEIESRIAKFEGIKQVCVDVKLINGTQHLCGYYTTEDGSNCIDVDALRAALTEHLTEFMIPEAFVFMEQFPLTPNGKVNKRILPLPELGSRAEYVDPEEGTEADVASCFAKVLGITEPVGALDSFYALGGDSIKAIRLVSVLREKGIVLQVAQVMKLKTVREIAGFALSQGSAQSVVIPQEAWSGSVPPTAITDFFFGLKLPDENHFLQSSTAMAKGRLDMDALRCAFDKLVEHHDMLRALVDGNSLTVREKGSENLYRIFEYEIGDLENLGERLLELGTEMRRSFNIRKEGMMRIGVYHLAQNDILDIAIHHLVVDGVSWRILLDDLQTLYSAVLQKIEPELPSKTHSYREYGAALDEFASNLNNMKEMAYWLPIKWGLPDSPHSIGNDFSRKFSILRCELDAGTTCTLLHGAAEAYHAEINDLLVAAVARAYRKVSGNDVVSLQMEGHGREQFSHSLVIDRTVGWFTSIYPVVIDGLNGDIGHDIRYVKESLRLIPGKGFAYGPLMGLDVDDMPLIGFNYLGEMDAEKAGDDAIFVPSPYKLGEDIAPRNAFGPSLSLNGSASDGILNFELAYDKALFDDDFANAFAGGFIGELKTVCEHCASLPEPEYTASDLGEKLWSDEEFRTVWDSFRRRGETLQRIYPLTPMQESMVLKYLSDPETEAYRIQVAVSMNVLLTESQMKEVLRQVAWCHEALRTSIIIKGVGVYRQAIVERELGLSIYDLSDLPSDEQKKAFFDILDKERKGGFDLQFTPLFGIIMAKTGDNSCFLCMNFHHIIVDGWCMSLINESLIQAMLNVTGMENIPLRNISCGTYEQYVRELAGKDYRKSLAYWKNLLEGYETKAIVPYDNPAPLAEPTPENDQVLPCDEALEIDADVMSQLKSLCKSEGISLNCAVELAWGIMLQAYNNTDDAVFAKVVSGRDNASVDVSETVGLFINSVPVRIHFTGQESVREALRSVHRQAVGTNEHDYCNLSDIMMQADLGQDLFQSIIGFQNFPDRDEAQDELIRFESLGGEEPSVNDISMQAYANENRLKINIKYDTSLYSRQTILRTLRLVANIIRGIATSPDGLLKDIPFVDQAETEDILRRSYGGDRPYDEDETYVDMFLAQAANHPDAVALVDGFADSGSTPGHLTYSELDRLTDRFAVYLTSNGVGKGDFVAVMLGRCKEFIVSVLAINKAGAAYVPVDPEYPEDRRQYMIEDSGAKLIVTEEILREIATADCGNPDTPPVNLAHPDGVAYMIYTSGTTGNPKGVMIRHRSIRACASWLIPAFDLRPGKRNMHHPSFSFDASTFDLFYPLAAGGAIYVLDDSVRKDLEEMNRFIRDNGITGMTMSTALGMELLNAYNLPIEYIMLGGEKFLPVKETGTKLFNGYGPTEFTCCSSYHVIDQKNDVDIPIGRAVPNSWSVICDRYGRILPFGMVGELCLAGDQIALGYWKRDDLTAAKFTNIKGTSLKAYHTGDLVRYNSDGEMMFLGRIDNQVKLRGFRIELGEIEQQAKSFHDIDKVVAGICGTGNARFICLYYTLPADSTISPDNSAAFEKELKEHLSRQLTEYMVPTAYMRLEKMPFTPGGKIDHKALPEPALPKTVRVEPQSMNEQKLFDIVSAVLGHSDFGVTDDLRFIGMSSILAIRTVAMANESGILLKLEDLLKAHSIRDVLSLQHNFCSWYSKPTADRPAVVLVQGETDFGHLQDYIEELDSRFSLLVVESIRAHYDYIFTDCDGSEVIELYYSLCEFKIEEAGLKAVAFTGHCFGSDIAYRLACRWAEEHPGEHPAIAMLDSFWVDQNRPVERIDISEIPQELKGLFEEKKDEVESFDRMYKSLNFCGEPQSYDGPVALFRATEFEHHLDLVAQMLNLSEDEVRERLHIDDRWIMWAWQPERTFDNEALWRSFRPGIECFDVGSDHTGILEGKFVRQYLDWIINNIGL